MSQNIEHQQQSNLQHQYDMAIKKLRDTPVGLNGRGPESEFAIAYQNLVKIGAAPQLKLKYR